MKTHSLLHHMKTYTIVTNCQKCPETHCYMKCTKVPCIELCTHLLTCNRNDYTEGDICKHLHKVQSIFNRDTGSCENLPKSLKEFKTDRISSNAYNILQLRFRSTVKNPGRKKNPLKKTYQQEKDKALQCLSSGKQEDQFSLRLITPKKESEAISGPISSFKTCSSN
jgi:hypothetical protein